MDNEQLTSDLSDRDKTILDLEKRAKLADVKTKKQMSELQIQIKSEQVKTQDAIDNLKKSELIVEELREKARLAEESHLQLQAKLEEQEQERKISIMSQNSSDPHPTRQRQSVDHSVTDFMNEKSQEQILLSQKQNEIEELKSQIIKIQESDHLVITEKDQEIFKLQDTIADNEQKLWKLNKSIKQGEAGPRASQQFNKNQFFSDLQEFDESIIKEQNDHGEQRRQSQLKFKDDKNQFFNDLQQLDQTQVKLQSDHAEQIRLNELRFREEIDEKTRELEMEQKIRVDQLVDQLANVEEKLKQRDDSILALESKLREFSQEQEQFKKEISNTYDIQFKTQQELQNKNMEQLSTQLKDIKETHLQQTTELQSNLDLSIQSGEVMTKKYQKLENEKKKIDESFKEIRQQNDEIQNQANIQSLKMNEDVDDNDRKVKDLQKQLKQQKEQSEAHVIQQREQYEASTKELQEQINTMEMLEKNNETKLQSQTSLQEKQSVETSAQQEEFDETINSLKDQITKLQDKQQEVAQSESTEASLLDQFNQHNSQQITQLHEQLEQARVEIKTRQNQEIVITQALEEQRQQNNVLTIQITESNDQFSIIKNDLIKNHQYEISQYDQVNQDNQVQISQITEKLQETNTQMTEIQNIGELQNQKELIALNESFDSVKVNLIQNHQLEIDQISQSDKKNQELLEQNKILLIQSEEKMVQQEKQSQADILALNAQYEAQLKEMKIIKEQQNHEKNEFLSQKQIQDDTIASLNKQIQEQTDIKLQENHSSQDQELQTQKLLEQNKMLLIQSEEKMIQYQKQSQAENISLNAQYEAQLKEMKIIKEQINHEKKENQTQKQIQDDTIASLNKQIQEESDIKQQQNHSNQGQTQELLEQNKILLIQSEEKMIQQQKQSEAEILTLNAQYEAQLKEMKIIKEQSNHDKNEFQSQKQTQDDTIASLNKQIQEQSDPKDRSSSSTFSDDVEKELVVLQQKVASTYQRERNLILERDEWQSKEQKVEAEISTLRTQIRQANDDRKHADKVTAEVSSEKDSNYALYHKAARELQEYKNRFGENDDIQLVVRRFAQSKTFKK